jgi:hypothetical protein
MASGQYQMQAGWAGAQRADAIRRGELAASAYRQDVEQVGGRQRTAYAAGGVDPFSGSAAQIAQETRTIGAIDALTIKNNAYREALGYEAQALSLRGQAEMTRQAGRAESRATLVTGGLSLLRGGMEAYAHYRKETEKPKKNKKREY